MSLWRRRAKDRDRDLLIKTALTSHFGEAIRELQREHATSEASITSSDASNNLCCVVEALFIHRLRDPFVDRVSHVLLSGDLIRQPEPNFWPFILSLSHRHDVDFLQTCGWIRTDVGRCRAWLRLAINEGLLASYLYTLSKDRKLLVDFYEKDALLRDTEQMDIIRRLLEGLEPFHFELAVNASILNHWTTTPLMLAGLWVPPTPIIQEAVVQGVDVAESLPEEEKPATVHHASLSVNVCSPMAVLDEELAFKLILDSSTPSGSGRQTPFEEPEASIGRMLATEVPSLTLGPRLCIAQSEGDSGLGSADLIGEPGMTVPVDSEAFDKTGVKAQNIMSPVEQKLDCLAKETSELDDFSQLTSTPDDSLYADRSLLHNTGGNNCVEEEEEEDFPALLKSYNSVAPTPDFFEFFKPTKSKEEEEASSKSGDSQPGDFEVLSSGEQSRASFMELVGKIATEKGLVVQNYRCLDCCRPIGILYGVAKVCGFTGGYFCEDCHKDEESVVPARIILNGDWSRRTISVNAAAFLRETESEPLLNVEKINPLVYDAFEEFMELRALRTQLNHLSAYLLTCRERVDEKFRKKLWPREHLYEHVPLYSLLDLQQVPNRVLAQTIQKVVSWARSHVVACFFCSQKGFICEFCQNEEPIFPFDISSVFRCELCGAVYHALCMKPNQPCPKCERRKSLQAKSRESGDES